MSLRTEEDWGEAYIANVSRTRIKQIEDAAIAKLGRFFATAQGRKILKELR